MLAIGLFLGGGIVLYLVWLLIRELAVYAVPFWIGLSVFLGLYHHQPGIFLPLGGGLLAAICAYVAWREIFRRTGSLLMRGVIALAFAAPSAAVGYFAGPQIATLFGVGAQWHPVVAIAAALYVGVLSWQRIVTYDSPALPQEHAPA